MADMGAIAGLLTSLNAAKNIAQAMITLHNTAAFQGKLIELQSAILDAQGSALATNEERSTLVQHVRQLEEQVTALKAWDADKQRYELKKVGDGTFAYALKPDAQGTEPPHMLCAHCYQQNQKRILQALPELRLRRRIYVCPGCKNEVAVA